MRSREEGIAGQRVSLFENDKQNGVFRIAVGKAILAVSNWFSGGVAKVKQYRDLRKKLYLTAVHSPSVLEDGTSSSYLL